MEYSSRICIEAECSRWSECFLQAVYTRDASRIIESTFVQAFLLKLMKKWRAASLSLPASFQPCSRMFPFNKIAVIVVEYYL